MLLTEREIEIDVRRAYESYASLAERYELITGDLLGEADALLHAAREMEIEPGRCIYVGDAGRDIEAGRAAGMLTVAANWGYIPEDDDPRDWAADRLLDEPSGIVELAASLARQTRGVA